MNRILTELDQKLHECLRTYLPEISESELEENGTVYYMNGKNGTEFDWHVNDRLSDFMVFYDDEDKLGAVKASVYRDGGMLIYVYGDRGKSVRQEIKDMYLDVTEEQMLRLAVMLMKESTSGVVCPQLWTNYPRGRPHQRSLRLKTSESHLAHDLLGCHARMGNIKPHDLFCKFSTYISARRDVRHSSVPLQISSNLADQICRDLIGGTNYPRGLFCTRTNYPRGRGC